MTRIARQRRKWMLLVFAILLMRAAIPPGYMPAAIGSDLLFELCPEGVPAVVMQSLGLHSHYHGESENDTAAFDVAHCPLGHMFSSIAAVEIDAAIDIDSAIPVFRPLSNDTRVASLHTVYRSRGPPSEKRA